MNNTLTPEMTNAFNQITGGKVNTANPNAGPSRADQIRAIASGRSGDTSNDVGGTPGKPFVGGAVGGIVKDLNQRGKNVIEDVNNISKNAEDAGGSPLAKAASVGSAVGHIAGEVAGGVGDILGHVISPFLPDSIKQNFGKVASDINTKVQSIPGMTPEIMKSLGDVFNTVTLLGGEKVAPKVAEVAGDVKNTVSGVKDTIASKVSGKSVDPIQTSVDAVNPDLTGKKLTGAYKQVVTGQRDSVSSSIFKEQGLTPNEQTVNLGKRLSDLGLGKDHVENLNILKTALEDTEAKVTTELEKNPNISANKEGLNEKLDAGRAQIPREFKGIKDSTNAFEDVINFAKEKVDAAEDDFKSQREARTEFDTKAKIEYPNAFKDGVVDVKTPAGRAIKFARDTMNQHLYETAPNGSEIQKLIGREADIFRATDNIAPKAAATHGQTGLEQTMDKHPVIKAGLNTVKKALPYAVGVHLP